jgi:hypothetical protein
MHKPRNKFKRQNSFSEHVIMYLENGKEIYSVENRHELISNESMDKLREVSLSSQINICVTKRKCTKC